MKQTKLLTPSFAMAAGVATSVFMWTVGRLNLLDSLAITDAEITFPGVFYGFATNAALLLTISVGTMFGRTALACRTPKTYSPRTMQRLQIAFTALAGLSLLITVGENSATFIELARSNRLNEVRDFVPRDAGIGSLRYFALPAVGMLVANRSQGEGKLLRDIPSTLIFVIVVAIGARTMLLAACAGTAVVAARSGRSLRSRPVVLAALTAALIFGIFNWQRNGNYYQERGVDSPIAAFVAELGRYFSSPVQAQLSLGASNVTPASSQPLAAVTPRIVRAEPDVGRDEERYGHYGTVEAGLTTNSAIADMTLQYGWFSLLGLGAAAFAYATWFGSMSTLTDPASAWLSGSILYGFSEVWRTWLMLDSFYLLNVAAFGLTLTVTSRHRMASRAAIESSLPLGQNQKVSVRSR